MKYTVMWKPSARRWLTELWIESTQKAAITAATNAFDCLAKTSPRTLGEQRDQSARLAIIGPLVFLFDVSDEDCRVDVLAVRLFPTQRDT